MKKWIVFLFSCFLLVGCNETIEQEGNLQGSLLTYPTTFKAESDEFLYELQVDKGSISSGDPIDIIASLTYIGEEDEIAILHAASPFYYDIKETTRGYEIEYPMDQPLISTTLKKGEPLTEHYLTSGGYSDNDDEDFHAFMNEFLLGNYPAGYYVVNGYVQFTVEGAQQKIELGGDIGFQVD